jgi:hypothetical protein
MTVGHVAFGISVWHMLRRNGAWLVGPTLFNSGRTIRSSLQRAEESPQQTGSAASRAVGGRVVNRITTLTIGIVAAIVASLAGLVLIPGRQLSPFGPVTVTMADGSQVTYPQPLDDYREQPGKHLYESLGCIYCHSQQVRPEGFGADLSARVGPPPIRSAGLPV